MKDNIVVVVDGVKYTTWIQPYTGYVHYIKMAKEEKPESLIQLTIKGEDE